MVSFNEKGYREDCAAALSTRARIDEVARKYASRGFESIVFVGVGGTWIEWGAVREIAQKRTALPIRLENAAEMVLERDLSYLNKRALIITSSVSGDTKEILAAVEFCRKRGLEVIGFTHDETTPLASLLADWIPMTTDYCQNNFLLYFTLVYSLLSQRGEFSCYERWCAAIEKTPDELLALRASFDPRADRIARKYHKAPYSIWVGSGAMYYCTYLFAMCLLEEMQWVRTRPVTAADFFHGNLELVEDGVPVFVVKGVDEFRPLDQRVDDFLDRYHPTDSAEILDMGAFPLASLGDEFREEAAVLSFCATVIDRLSRQYEHYTGHSLAFRRYYRQLDY